MSPNHPILELPYYETRLIGRDRARTSLIEHLQHPEQRIITLVGSSGAGKTRLALQVAQELAVEYERVTFVALAPVRLPILVLPTILQTLGLREGGAVSAIDLLARSFEKQRLLLILDNFEQVLEAGSHLESMIDRLPGLRILVTSQEPLGLEHETVFQVPPLSVPQVENLSVAEALVYSSVRLFIDRIQAVQPDFELEQAEVESVVDICRRVRGLPLAIELIAAHSHVLKPSDLSMLVRNHLSMGRNLSPRYSVSRQEILWPVLDWSYRMLNPQLQQIFDCLGAFWGGCTVQSAAAICTHFDQIQVDMSQALAELVSKHLIQTETLSEQTTRFIMLDSVQEYASEHLQRQRDAAAIHAYHAEYYLMLTDQARQFMTGAEQASWFQRLNEDIHNIRKAINWLLEQQNYQQALELCSNIYLFWQMQGFLTEGRRWLHEGLQHKDYVDPAIVAAAQHAHGVLIWSQGEFEEAQQLFTENLELQKQVNDVEGVAKTLNNLANLQYNYGHYDQAIKLYLECLESLQVLGDKPRVAAVMGNVGVVYNLLNDAEKAWFYKRESLRLRREIGSEVDIVYSLSNLGRDAIRDGDYDQALVYLNESYQLLERVQERFLMASVLSNLGLVHFYIGNSAQAHTFATQGVFTRHSIGDLRGMPNALIVLALIFAKEYPVLMAHMLGYTMHYLEQKKTPFTPYTKVLYDQTLERMQAEIPELEPHFKVGAEMSIDDLLTEFERLTVGLE